MLGTKELRTLKITKKKWKNSRISKRKLVYNSIAEVYTKFTKKALFLSHNNTLSTINPPKVPSS